MPNYVILHHEFPGGSDRQSHWDMMFQLGDLLLTWEVAQCPQPGMQAVARQLDDHRLEYLDYSGPISGNRGTVSRWDWGSYQGDPSRSSSFSLQLQGVQFEGRFQLEPIEGTKGEWSVTFPG